MNKKADLADVLRSAGGGTRRKEKGQQENEDQVQVEGREEQKRGMPYQQPSRKATKPITVHFPKEVRNQLKILAVEHDNTMQDLIAEALNDLFAKYGKPEIAPVSSKAEKT